MARTLPAGSCPRNRLSSPSVWDTVQTRDLPAPAARSISAVNCARPSAAGDCSFDASHPQAAVENRASRDQAAASSVRSGTAKVPCGIASSLNRPTNARAGSPGAGGSSMNGPRIKPLRQAVFSLRQSPATGGRDRRGRRRRPREAHRLDERRGRRGRGRLRRGPVMKVRRGTTRGSRTKRQGSR